MGYEKFIGMGVQQDGLEWLVLWGRNILFPLCGIGNVGVVVIVATVDRWIVKKLTFCMFSW